MSLIFSPAGPYILQCDWWLQSCRTPARITAGHFRPSYQESGRGKQQTAGKCHESAPHSGLNCPSVRVWVGMCVFAVKGLSATEISWYLKQLRVTLTWPHPPPCVHSYFTGKQNSFFKLANAVKSTMTASSLSPFTVWDQLSKLVPHLQIML